MKVLTRDEILAADDLPQETVEIPEWGGNVIIRTIMAEDRDKLETWAMLNRTPDQGVNTENLRARLVALSAVDEEGKHLFDFNDPKEIKALGKKSASAVDRLFAVAQRLSGLRRTDVEELTQNLPGGQSGGSASS